MEALPIFLDALVNPYAAIAISVTAVRPAPSLQQLVTGLGPRRAD